MSRPSAYGEDLVSSYEQVIGAIVSAITSVGAFSSDRWTDLVQVSCTIFEVIQSLHSELGHLPRPSEPVELRRFARLVDKYIIHQQVFTTHIYADEATSEAAFAGDPLRKLRLAEIEGGLMEPLRLMSYAAARELPPIGPPIPANRLHLSLPRIDSANPCRWPSLMHEVGHTLLSTGMFENREIDEDFLAHLTETQRASVESAKNEIGLNLKTWLTECWCDLVATIVFGSALLCSQSVAFLFAGKSYSSEYPSRLFRLSLMQSIIRHRFGVDRDYWSAFDHTYQALIELYFPDLDRHRPHWINLQMLFREYFLTHLFGSDQHESSLNVKLSKVLGYSTNIDPAIISELVSDLSSGIPIPGVRRSRSSQTESFTSMQEILLAGWSYRLSRFRAEVEDRVRTLPASKSYADALDSFRANVVPLFDRLDQSLLKSLQVSEWFDLYSKVEDDVDFLQSRPRGRKLRKRKADGARHLLVDWQIAELLASKALRVVPMVSLSEQLGSSSLDLRLGTNFLVYNSNRHGIVYPPIQPHPRLALVREAGFPGS
jgi:hypothetical protein